jgi:dedicator of cytokinesis protein 6/7/8
VLAQTLKAFDFLPKEKLIELLGTSKNVLQADSAKNALESFYSRRTEGAEKINIREQRATQRRFATARRGRSQSEGGDKIAGSGEGYEDPLTGMTSYEYDERLEMNLNTEASMVVLDVVEDFIKLFEPSFKQGMLKHVSVMEKFLKLLLEFMKRTQSTAFLNVYHRLLRSYVNRFPVYLFQYKAPNNNMNPCGPLTHVLVKQLVSNSYDVRSHASALLYLMMKRNFENRSNFNRMRTETTVALTKLLDTNGIQDDTNYRLGLGAILRYAELDFPDTANGFRVGLQELMNRLFRLLKFSVQLTKEKDDPEMQADLYHSIALDYRNAPELRVSWK